MTDLVAMDAQVAAFLIAGALDDLWYADQEEGCCPQCCAPCAALKQLLDAGRLDDLVRPYEEQFSSETWLNGEVDRNFLARAWRMTDCHDETCTCDG